MAGRQPVRVPGGHPPLLEATADQQPDDAVPHPVGDLGQVTRSETWETSSGGGERAVSADQHLDRRSDRRTGRDGYVSCHHSAIPGPVCCPEHQRAAPVHMNGIG
jgi:hypothetical protein